MGLLRKFQPIPPRSSLLTYNNLNYADMIYDQAWNSAFYEKLESIQYNACLAITGALRPTSTEKLYHKLGLASLKSRSWPGKLCDFYNMLNEKSPSYII